MEKPTWKTERKRLGDLVPWPGNPRTIEPEEAKRLAESFEEFGQVETIAIGPSSEIFNGHQRLKVLLAQHGPDYEVDVRVASRALSEEERQKLTVFLHKGTTGDWDFELLTSSFEIDDLIDWGFKSYELGIVDEIDTDEMWEGMPEFEQGDLTALRSLKVNFATQEDVDVFAKLVDQKITDKTTDIWYPRADKIDQIGKAYKDGS